MAKASLEEKITKVQDAIAKEEAIIAQSQKKLKDLKDDLKALEKEQYVNAMNSMGDILKQYGITPQQATQLIIQNCSSNVTENNAPTSQNSTSDTKDNNAPISQFGTKTN